MLQTIMATVLALSLTVSSAFPPVSMVLTSKETVKKQTQYTHYDMEKVLPNQDVFSNHKLEMTGKGQNTVTLEIPLEGTQGTATYVDSARKWHTVDIFSDLPVAALYIETDKMTMMLDPAYHYYDRSATSLEEYAVVEPWTFSATKSGLVARTTVTNLPNLQVHFWCLSSHSKLVDLTQPNQQHMWGAYCQRQYQRFCYDGYYYQTPVGYDPYGSAMFWRNPSSYTVSAFTQTAGSRASQDLSYAWLDVIVENQDEKGYWVTYPRSVSFLYHNYGMPGGFYDTRFNTDITETLLVAYTQTKDSKFLKAAEAQLAFYMDFASNHHYTIEKNGTVGYLVEDYYHPDMPNTKTHSSLNHHLAEIYTLYLAYEITGNQTYLDFTEPLMQGIRNSRDLWVMADHGLEYAYLPNGTMGFTDYPYLTYNDLFEVQKMRESLGLGSDSDLDYLMGQKMIEMTNKGITGYHR